ncbi:STM4015 family protein [Actinomadura flavalba]|uniref:STM4015 family protein n=1 Tax=Actinomadura flavalba TaxID=1120938 RepID=UPI00035FCD09|nr:STM4015 family protein [Actinomadura flavalba]
MTINQHLSEYAGLPVEEFSNTTAQDAVLPPAGERAWRVRTEYDETPITDVWRRFREQVDTTQVTTLIFGFWAEPYEGKVDHPVYFLLKAAAEFPNLRSLFIGDLVMEESEVSWIHHNDITPLFAAFPALERFDLRGSQELRLEPFSAPSLRTLRFEDGGLPGHIVRAVGASDLPNLEHLDLWLGTDNYGGDATVGDLAPILAGDRLPALKHLGLENAEIADEVAAAVAGAPIVARLEELSLALGALSDQGAEALLSGQPLTHLRVLDLHHHFMEDAMMQRVRSELPNADVSSQQPSEDEWRFITVSE